MQVGFEYWFLEIKKYNESIVKWYLVAFLIDTGLFDDMLFISKAELKSQKFLLCTSMNIFCGKRSYILKSHVLEVLGSSNTSNISIEQWLNVICFAEFILHNFYFKFILSFQIWSILKKLKLTGFSFTY